MWWGDGNTVNKSHSGRACRGSKPSNLASRSDTFRKTSCALCALRICLRSRACVGVRSGGSLSRRQRRVEGVCSRPLARTAALPSTPSTRASTTAACRVERRRRVLKPDAALRTGHVLVVRGELDLDGLRVPLPELRLQRAAAIGRALGIAAFEDGRIDSSFVANSQRFCVRHSACIASNLL